VVEFCSVRTSQDEPILADSPPKPAAGGGKIPSLDGLRAVSIILVLIGHAVPIGTWFNGPHSFALRAAFLHSDLGVRAFFVISGYLITGLLLNERSKSGTISLRLFYIRRALRILPAFFLYVGVVALLNILGVIQVPAWSWVYALTYTVNFVPTTWVLGHLWTLSVEEQFYLLWPLVMKLATPRTCAVVAVMAIFAAPVTHVVLGHNGIHLPTTAFPVRCGPIAMGCLLAIGAGKVRTVIVSSRLLSDGRTLLSTLVLIALLEAIPMYVGARSSLLTMAVDFMLTFCVAQVIFVSTGVAGRFLNAAPMTVIGKLSYSLYLWQELFLNTKSAAPVALPFPGNFLAIFAIASASYWGLETRFLELRQRFRGRPQPL
jgi:peptidoglycan/LPS O-acetylase OafA/YrhL